jgi:hypothetical protein
LGSIYKILAKTLVRRIQKILPLVIRPNQTGFVEGRSILNNNFLVEEALVWAAESNQDFVLLLLDFEKTFDKIMGLPLPNLIQTGFLPHLDSMDLFPLLACVLINQSKQGTWRGLKKK